jgi:hypothetical protein
LKGTEEKEIKKSGLVPIHKENILKKKKEMNPVIDWKKNQEDLLIALDRVAIDTRRLLYVVLVNDVEFTKIVKKRVSKNSPLDPTDKFALSNLRDKDYGFYRAEEEAAANPRVVPMSLAKIGPMPQFKGDPMITILEFCLIEYDHRRLKNLHAMNALKGIDSPILKSIGFYDIVGNGTTDSPSTSLLDYQKFQKQISDWCTPQEPSQLTKYYARYGTFALLSKYVSDSIGLASLKKCIEFGDFLGALILINTCSRPEETGRSTLETDYAYENPKEFGGSLEVKMWIALVKNYACEFEYSGPLVNPSTLLQEAIELIKLNTHGKTKNAPPFFDPAYIKGKYPTRFDFMRFIYSRFPRAREQHESMVAKDFGLLVRCIKEVRHSNCARWLVEHLGLEKGPDSRRVGVLMEELMKGSPDRLSDVTGWLNELDPQILRDYSGGKGTDTVITHAIQDYSQGKSIVSSRSVIEMIRGTNTRTRPSDVENLIAGTLRRCFETAPDSEPEVFANDFYLCLRSLSGILPVAQPLGELSAAAVYRSIDAGLRVFDEYYTSATGNVELKEFTPKLFVECSKKLVTFMYEIGYTADFRSDFELFILNNIDFAFSTGDLKGLGMILHVIGKTGALVNEKINMKYCTNIASRGLEIFPESDDYTCMVPVLSALSKKSRDQFIIATIDSATPNWGVFKTWAEVEGDRENTRYPKLPGGAAKYIVEGYKRCFAKYSLDSFQTLFSVMWDSSSSNTIPSESSYEQLLDRMFEPWEWFLVDAKGASEKLNRYLDLTQVRVSRLKYPVFPFWAALITPDYKKATEIFTYVEKNANRAEHVKLLLIGLELISRNLCISALPPQEGFTVFSASTPNIEAIEQQRSAILSFLNNNLQDWRDHIEPKNVSQIYENALLMMDTILLEFLFDDFGLTLYDVYGSHPGAWLVEAARTDDDTLAKLLSPRTLKVKDEVSHFLHVIVEAYESGKTKVAEFLIRRKYLTKTSLGSAIIRKCAMDLLSNQEEEEPALLWVAEKVLGAVEGVVALKKLGPVDFSEQDLHAVLFLFLETLTTGGTKILPGFYLKYVKTPDVNTIIKYCLKIPGCGAVIYFWWQVARDILHKEIDMSAILSSALRVEDISLLELLIEFERTGIDRHIVDAISWQVQRTRENVMEKLLVSQPGMYHRVKLGEWLRKSNIDEATREVAMGATIEVYQIPDTVNDLLSEAPMLERNTYINKLKEAVQQRNIKGFFTGTLYPATSKRKVEKVEEVEAVEIPDSEPEIEPISNLNVIEIED